MYTFLLILLILDGLLLTVVILLQSGKGGGLAAMGGAGTSTDSVIGGRQAATLLTKASWIGGAAFLGLALVLSILSSRATTADSILRQEFQQAPGQPLQPVVPGATPQGGAQPEGATQIPGTQPAGEPQPDGQ
ncbi:MAG: preprotein translocase subunit SecG [Longimicrobiales bacterium]